ncbi:HTH domain-containing protein [Noviherbaspirillum saxi]|uniref:HTH domain-containing protein n=1 Tax=Noviherbaspirillum saxi TaxID=2320863 RepID=A0A3A3G6Y0_9BURK|nr:HTH domain-containing protein [Noviherbaspirillum saxi]RJF95940.1 HTH domain-containing protein [Noviherbaspirillum saxi]
MLEILGGRQRELLELLQKNKVGMTADGLSEGLAITRNAVRQHLATLENDGLVKKGLTRASGGRPEQLYVLTEKGQECFPRHYSWFAQLLVESIEEEVGKEGFAERLDLIGERVGRQLLRQHHELSTPADKIEALSAAMKDLGYNAHTQADEQGAAVIEADNCVFHNLAMKNPNVCRFDLALLSTFSGCEVEHQECMAKNGNVCRFRFKEPS